jgi:hypothetical protein
MRRQEVEPDQRPALANHDGLAFQLSDETRVVAAFPRISLIEDKGADARGASERHALFPV